jgi:hypothetical protein
MIRQHSRIRSGSCAAVIVNPLKFRRSCKNDRRQENWLCTRVGLCSGCRGRELGPDRATLARHGSRESMMQTESTLTCPHCGYQATETMPIDACQIFYDCKGCGRQLRPKLGIAAYLAGSAHAATSRRHRCACCACRDSSGDVGRAVSLRTGRQAQGVRLRKGRWTSISISGRQFSRWSLRFFGSRLHRKDAADYHLLGINARS